MRTLIIIRGLPGAGKSSFAHFLWASGIIFEADKYFYDEYNNYNFDASKLHAAHEWCQLKVENAMLTNKGTNGKYYPEVIVSNTSTTEKELKPYLDLAAKYDYKVVSLIVENRHGNENKHGVPDDKIEQMRNRFEINL